MTSVAILFRRRFPWPVLVLTFVVAAVSAGVRASQPAGFYLVMAVYSLVVVSSRRTALIVVSIVSAGLIAAVIAGGGGSSRVVPAAIGSVALDRAGLAGGENVRANSGLRRAVQGTGRRAGRRCRGGTGRAGSPGACPTSGWRSPGSCMTSWPTP